MQPTTNLPRKRCDLHSFWLLLLLWTIQSFGAGVALAGANDRSDAHPAVGEQFTTDDFAEMHAAAVRLGQKYGPERVLVVLDIDNTLLSMNQDLGSDQWFGWQRELIDKDPNSPDAVARDFQGLLDAQGLLFSLSRMTPPQKDAPKLVADLQERGFPAIVMTSRSEAFRDAAERELGRNGYHMAKSALPANVPCFPTYSPYSLQDLPASGLTAEDADFFQLKEANPVSYRAGIFMIAGQHKGAMLLTLLARSDVHLSAIVFIDDRPRHAQRVYDAFMRRGILDVQTFRYSRDDERVAKFLASDKQEVIRGWRNLQETLQTVFQ